MLRISIQKNRFIKFANLNPMAHFLTTLDIHYKNKQVAYLINRGVISNLHNLLNQLERFDFFSEIAIKNDENDSYTIKVPMCIEWENSCFITTKEPEAKMLLEDPMYAELASIIQVGRDSFYIEGIVFKHNLSLSASREIDLKIDNIAIDCDLKIYNFIGKIHISQSVLVKNVVDINSQNSADTKEIHFNGGAYSEVKIYKSFFKKITLCNLEIDYGYFFDNIIEEKANFYGSIFKKCPNFSQSSFDKKLNLINTQLDFNYDNTLFEINREYNERSITEATRIDYIANNFRDSFRLFKNALSKEGNAIDASNYHRVELYCKEIELDSKPNKKLQDKIDKWQLWFYRQTSEHHTDLLRSFHTLIALIGIFGLLCGSVVLGFDYFIFDYQKGFDILQLKGFFLDNINKSIASHLLEYFVGNVILVFVFLGLFLGVIWECSREVLVSLGYIATLGFLATSPKYLIPAMSLFGGKWVALNPLGTIGGVYTLLFGFLAYSFIKTARKNSIIPS